MLGSNTLGKPPKLQICFDSQRGRQLHMFHDFTGFSFDNTCLGNASALAH